MHRRTFVGLLGAGMGAAGIAKYSLLPSTSKVKEDFTACKLHLTNKVPPTIREGHKEIEGDFLYAPRETMFAKDVGTCPIEEELIPDRKLFFEFVRHQDNPKIRKMIIDMCDRVSPHAKELSWCILLMGVGFHPKFPLFDRVELV